MKYLLTILFSLAAICTSTIAADRTPELDDLRTHIGKLTLVLVGRPEHKLPKVGDSPAFTKIFTGGKAFGTNNDSWFGSAGASASDQQVDTNRMGEAVAVLTEAGQMVRRTVRIDDPIEHRFEGAATNLTCAALAVGYESGEMEVVYYLVKLDGRKHSVAIFQRLKELMRGQLSSASTVVGNILSRLER